MSDYVYYAGAKAWVHPETLVVILDEDLPWELKPEDEHHE